jgi:hypothetical protein
METLARINGHGQLRAPPQLSLNERKVFGEVVSSVRAGHFEASDLALLVEFSRLAVLVGALWEAYHQGEDEEALANLTTAQKSLFACCRLLRLAPSARTPNHPTREGQRRSAGRQRLAPSGSFYDAVRATEIDDAS